MEKRSIRVCLSLFFLIISLSAFTPEVDAQQSVIKLSMGTGGTGGVFYVMGGGIANILTKYMPNTEVTVEVTGGSVDNCKLLNGISIKMIPCGEAIIQLDKKYPGGYYATVIPKGTYPGIDYDVPSIGHTNLFVTLDKMDTQVAYTITRTLFDHINPDLVAVHKEAAKINLKTITTGSPIPWHLGAVKFYAERGVQVK